MIGEWEHPAGAHGHILNIKPGGKPTMGMISEFRVTSDASEHPQCSGERVSL